VIADQALDRGAERQSAERPYMVVSCDSHAGPSLERSLRPYCPSKYLDEFDAYAKVQREYLGPELYFGDDAKYANTLNCEGHNDASARLRDMDASGVAAAVVFGGGQNHEAVSFLGFGFDAGSSSTSRELRKAGERIWNEWLCDHTAESPARLYGVMQAPLWDVAYAVEEIEHFHDRGLKAVNFPSPRSDFPAYNDPRYEPIWNLCVERDIPLVSHSGGGERSLGWDGPGGMAVTFAETQWLCRRHLPQLIFGGVFERHPGLKVVFTEQRVEWVSYTLKEYDSLYYSDMANPEWRAPWPKVPSVYWREHCYIAGSFLAPFEVDQRDRVGVRNLMWGDDYPHVEGTWPNTMACMQDTFAAVPEGDARLILGENAIDVYGFDRPTLQGIAERIGPLPSAVASPASPVEVPAHPSLTFRRRGPWS
jgi:predicted TIM-barrel fold metal-dependent hydrolase